MYFGGGKLRMRWDRARGGPQVLRMRGTWIDGYRLFPSAYPRRPEQSGPGAPMIGLKILKLESGVSLHGTILGQLSQSWDHAEKLRSTNGQSIQ